MFEKQENEILDKLSKEVSDFRSDCYKKECEMHKLLETFGIYRGCSNCENNGKCVVQNSYNVYHVKGAPLGETLCNEKYWALKEVKNCDCNHE
jgi:hypothetical protein